MNDPVFPLNLDFRPVTRPGLETRVEFSEERSRDGGRWFIGGEASLQVNGDRATVVLRYRGNVTDLEHDSAIALAFDVIGLTFQGVIHGVAEWTGYVTMDEGGRSFRVPRQVTPIEELPGYQQCTYCTDPHPFTLQYLPPHDPELYERVRGRRVRIQMYAPRLDSGESP